MGQWLHAQASLRSPRKEPVAVVELDQRRKVLIDHEVQPAGPEMLVIESATLDYTAAARRKHSEATCAPIRP